MDFMKKIFGRSHKLRELDVTISPNIPKLNISDIVQEKFSAKQYYRKQYEKKQAVIHHTVSGTGVTGDISTWLNDPYRIATCLIIARDGTIHQCFSTKYWAHHLGVTSDFLKSRGLKGNENLSLNRHSVAIELDSYGGLIKKNNGQWETIYGNIVEKENVIEYPDGYRGYYGFEKYTKEQLISMASVLVYLNGKYGIPLDYMGDEMFDVDNRALEGKPGIFTHTSYRKDKSDCHPQEELKIYLKALKRYEN